MEAIPQLVQQLARTEVETVAAGGELGGVGQIIDSDVNILAGGILSPGDEFGTLRIDQSLDLAGIYEWQIRSSKFADVVTVGNDLSISGMLSVNFLTHLDFDRFDKFTLFGYQGTFSGGFSNKLDGWLINYSDKEAGINGIDQVGAWKYVTLTSLEASQRLIRMSDPFRIDRLTAVPEPSSLGVVVGSLLFVIGSIRRKRI